MLHKGYDVFYLEPDTATSIKCGVCGREILPLKKQNGPTSFIQGMAGTKNLHDLFMCPDHDKEWHQQSFELVQAIEKMPSKRVVDLMKQDLQELLDDRK